MQDISSKKIHITGLVQGVGFRPFIFRLATQCHIPGWVENRNDGVWIHAEGAEQDLEEFIGRIKAEAPPASRILAITVEDTSPGPFNDFSIRMSSDHSAEITEISPDIAVCDECLDDMKDQPHRIGYPFINCTNCGPRFTIIRDLPYDRQSTTMDVFPMCPVCRKEYGDVYDRRFHAQPVACNHCGPHYQMSSFPAGKGVQGGIPEWSARLIDDGNILAIKGLGGYHLACNALDEAAVTALRSRKNREGKPFAVMFRSLEDARQFLSISETEASELESWIRPIVILNNLEGGKRLASGVSNGFTTTGIMLPYMPFHYQLFGFLTTPAIVLTSGNISDEPVIISDREAEENLHTIADFTISYNREIFNRADDSVMMVVGGKPRLIRRSRGYAPAPVNLMLEAEGIFAAGAELVNCFCIGRGRQAIMSQHIGDLKNLETLDFYTESFRRFCRMFRVKPTLLACDMHPDYLSTRFAEEYATGHGAPPLVRIQHHHAHIAACMLEYGLDQKVIGISLDGVGFGTDGHIWGYETMVCDLLDFKRVAHLEYVPQPGGDLATLEPWRMAMAYLFKYSSGDFAESGLPFTASLENQKISLVMTALERQLNTPLVSSAGRLFDAVAALTGVCLHPKFHAEAPMRLENIIDAGTREEYDFPYSPVISPGPMIRQIVTDIRNGVRPEVISGKFHRSVVQNIIDTALFTREQEGLNHIILSGGTFQNRYILRHTEEKLKASGFEVYTPSLFPANDGGIALGQLAIAAKRRAEGWI